MVVLTAILLASPGDVLNGPTAISLPPVEWFPSGGVVLAQKGTPPGGCLFTKIKERGAIHSESAAHKTIKKALIRAFFFLFTNIIYRHH